jgi:hypothetical protein
MDKYTSLENIIRARKKNSPLIETKSERYSRICTSIRTMYEQRSKIEKDAGDQLTVGVYRTKHFEMQPKAQLLYTSLPKDIDSEKAEDAAYNQDKLFALEKEVTSKESASEQDMKQAKEYVDRIEHIAKQIGLEKEHSYIHQNYNNILKYTDTAPSVATTDAEVEKMKKRMASPPYDRNPDPKKDMDLDSKDFLIRRNIKAQRKIKIIDGD